MRSQDFIESIPIAILTILGIYSLIEVMTTQYVFGIRQDVGLILLSVSIILFFANRRIYKYIFGITLLLGLVTLVGFSTSIVNMYFLGVPIQILLIPIIAVFTWILKEEIKPKIRELIGTTEAQVSVEREVKINGFKRRFKNLSDSEINSKLNQNLVPEAIEALKQIKKERNLLL